MIGSASRKKNQKPPVLRCLSLGAGVQSTTLALMAAHGEFGERPDCAIFADTGWEPQAVYEHQAWLSSPNVLPFPVHKITSSNIRDDLLQARKANGRRFASIPFFTLEHRPIGTTVPVLDVEDRIVGHRQLERDENRYGIGRRQCTREYKIDPITKHMRSLLGYRPRQRIPDASVEVWIGISMDEVIRMKPARSDWQINRWPLIEKRMTRQDCLNWIARHGYPEPPKSSCIGCPFHSDAHWRTMRDQAPDEWDEAVRIDRLIRKGGTLRGMRAKQYMHRSCRPLDEVDLDASNDARQLDLMLNECEGHCGV